MRSALRSSAIEILMLVLFIAWGAIFSASLLNPGVASFEGRAAASSEAIDAHSV
ncbi:MAG TPA: hypothetical protein VJS42_09830 [Steroidobacteraceae bacterium]|nr:hypothetical protein [Steroidobacteraceae bacterium]